MGLYQAETCLGGSRKSKWNFNSPQNWCWQYSKRWRP